jgi:glycosyltransferase involved in cell wall biosynthesis
MLPHEHDRPLSADRADLPQDQPIVDKFYDYCCYRNDWIIRHQEKEDVKAILGKRLAQIVEKYQRKIPPVSVRQSFPQRLRKIQEYSAGYPQHDLTIVIPVYNGQDFIEAVIHNALNVPGITTDVLVMDDGSQDGTAEICQKLAEKHKNLHFFQQKNRGAGRARNALIPLCTGLYTYFIDADDVFDAERLAKAVKEARKRDNDLYFMQYKIEHYEKKKVLGMLDKDQAAWKNFRNAKSHDELRKMVAPLVPHTWTHLVKTELLHDANLFFGPSKVGNDILFHWESVLAAKNIGYGEYAVCTYRLFEQREQLSNRFDHRKLELFDALELMHRRLLRNTNGRLLFDAWNGFVLRILKWLKTVIPEDLQPQYEARKAKLLNLLAAAGQQEGTVRHV